MLDPVLRVYGHSACACLCSVSDLILTDVPLNAAVFAVASVLGPPPGAYRGDYPTPADVWSVIEADSVVVDGAPTSIAPGLPFDRDSVPGWGRTGRVPTSETIVARASDWYAVVYPARGGAGSGFGLEAALVDRATGEVFGWVDISAFDVGGSVARALFLGRAARTP